MFFMEFNTSVMFDIQRFSQTFPLDLVGASLFQLEIAADLVGEMFEQII